MNFIFVAEFIFIQIPTIYLFKINLIILEKKKNQEFLCHTLFTNLKRTLL